MTWEQWCDSKGAFQVVPPVRPVRLVLQDLARLARRQRQAMLDGKLREARQ